MEVRYPITEMEGTQMEGKMIEDGVYLAIFHVMRMGIIDVDDPNLGMGCPKWKVMDAKNRTI